MLALLQRHHAFVTPSWCEVFSRIVRVEVSCEWWHYVCDLM